MRGPGRSATFPLLCTGQTISLVGSQLTAFGLGVWSYQRTGSPTVYGLIALAALAPGMLAAPFAGVLVDRSARAAMLAGHLGAGLCTLLLALLVHLEAARLGAVLALVALTSVSNSVQFPGLSAVTPRIVPPEHLGRANGALQFGTSLSQIVSPLLAAVLLTRAGMGTILALDGLTFLFASLVLLGCRLPSAPREAGTPAPTQGLWAGVRDGWHHLRVRPGLMGLLALLALLNFVLGAAQVLVTPFVLGFTQVEVLGRIMTFGGLGMALGSVLLLVWGGPPRNRVPALLGFALVEGVSVMALGLFQPTAALVAGCAFGALFAVPLLNGCAQVLWQRKIPADLQGRVFGVRLLFAQGALPLAYLIAGPLAEHVFEPLMQPTGALARSVGGWLGTGPGRGIALCFVLLGGLCVLGVGLAARSRRLRHLEQEIPDNALSAGRRHDSWANTHPDEVFTP